MHKVLQRFHDSGDRGVETIYEALAAIDEDWIDAGYTSGTEMMEARGEGREIIQAYIDDLESRPGLGTVLFVEKTLRYDMGEFSLVGRLDRVDEHSDGTLEIIDYKTGRTSVTQDEVETDLALSCYQLLLKHAYPERRVIATMIALKGGMRASAEVSEEDLTTFEKDLHQLGIEILNRDFYEVEPVWKPLCGSCDFLTLCRKHPEFDEQ